MNMVNEGNNDLSYWNCLVISAKPWPTKVAILTTRYGHKDSKSLNPKIVLVWQARFVVLPGLFSPRFPSGFREPEAGILSLTLTHRSHFYTLNTFIKASRVAHLTDARYFAAKEVDYLGFNLEEGTEGYLDPMYMKAIREWVEGPKIVGEFSRTPFRVVREAAVFYGLDAVQVTAQNYGKDLAELEGLELILEINVGDQGLLFSKTELQQFSAQADVFLFNFSQPIISKSTFYADMDFWKEICSLRPSLFQGNFPAHEWPEMLEILGLAGLSLVGGEEEQVGVKSYDQIDEVFEALGRG